MVFDATSQEETTPPGNGHTFVKIVQYSYSLNEELSIGFHVESRSFLETSSVCISWSHFQASVKI